MLVTFACLARMIFMSRQRMKGLLMLAEIRKFHIVIWQTSSKNCTNLQKKKSCTCGTILKIAPHVQHDYFSSCSQSNHWFLALSLLFPSSFLKLPIAIVDPHLKYYVLCFSVSLLVLSSCGVQFASSGTIRTSSSPRCACGTCQWILARSRYRRRRSKFDRTKQKSVFIYFY